MKLGAAHLATPFRNAQSIADLRRFLRTAIHRFFHRAPVLSSVPDNEIEEKALVRTFSSVHPAYQRLTASALPALESSGADEPLSERQTDRTESAQPHQSWCYTQ